MASRGSWWPRTGPIHATGSCCDSGSTSRWPQRRWPSRRRSACRSAYGSGTPGRGAPAVIAIANIGRAIPSVGWLGIVFPVALLVLGRGGLGFVPSVIALTALGIPPIVVNTYAGMREVDPELVEAGRGMGMTERQLVRRVEVPVALPVILAGVRISAVQIVATATLATIVGGGTLGAFIVQGIEVRALDRVVGAAMLVALLAILTELGFALLERRAVSPGLRGQARLAADPARRGRDPRSRSGLSQIEAPAVCMTGPVRSPAVDLPLIGDARAALATHPLEEMTQCGLTARSPSGRRRWCCSSARARRERARVRPARPAQRPPICRRSRSDPPASRRRPWSPRSTPRPSRTAASPSIATSSSANGRPSGPPSTADEINLAPDYIGGLAAFLEAEVTSDPDETQANIDRGPRGARPDERSTTRPAPMPTASRCAARRPKSSAWSTMSDLAEVGR